MVYCNFKAVRNIFLPILFLGGFIFADPTDGCELGTNQLFLTVPDTSGAADVFYNSDTDIGGFQWTVDGTTASGASGGAAADAGFTVQAGGSVVLGFSFTGASIPAGCGTLTVLALDGTATGLSGIVISDPAANSVPFTYWTDDGGGQNCDEITDEQECLDNDCDWYIADDGYSYCEEGFPACLTDCANYEYWIDISPEEEGTNFCNWLLDDIIPSGCSDDCDDPEIVEVIDTFPDVCTDCLLAGDCDTVVADLWDDGDDCPSDNYDCEGVCDGTAIEDCTGECGGSYVIDECGVCGGENSNQDCLGVCFGDAEFDECGECGGSGADVMCDDGSYVCDAADCPTSGGGVSGGCDLDTNQLFLASAGDVFYNSTTDIGGFQWNVDGTTASGASGGDAADAGFTVQAGGSVVLGFSFTGSFVPAGCGTLTILTLDGTATGLSSIVISDPGANSVPFTYCSSCTEAGDDCPSDIYDCEGVCDGSAMVDDCGECGGDNSCYGCTYDDACNYDPDATLDDGSCVYEEECTDCNGECSCYVDCSGECGGSDYSCFTTNDDLLGEWSIDSIAMYENSDCTGDVVTIYECMDDGDDYTSEAECLANCDDVCESWAEFAPSYVIFSDDGTLDLFFLDEGSPCSDDSECVADTDEPDMLCGETGHCMTIASEFWGIDPNGCFHTWEVDEYGQLEYGADEGCSTYIIDGDDLTITGEDGDYCQEINLSTTVIGCMDNLATNYDDEALSPCGDCCEYDSGDTHFNVEIAGTGESTLFIFQDTIEGLDSGDEFGVYDMAGVVDDQGNVGMILVGAGTWTGSQLEVVGIGAVDLSEFGGPILPGAVDGNTMSLKVWDSSDMMEYDATYTTSSGSGTFNGLFTAIDSIELVPQDPPHFSVEIAGTGESTLFIFQDIIEGLDSGDELGVFDASGVIDDTGTTGEILVGAGVWNGSQLEIVGIGAVDLSEFGGPILPGAVEGNNMSLKVWKDSEEVEYAVIYGTSSGSGTFNGLFTAINSISFTAPCEDDDAAVAPFDCASAVAQFGCDFAWGDSTIGDLCPETCDQCPAYGCTDEAACNYDSDAAQDDGSCSYPNNQIGECDCEGTLFDCAGDCGGDAFIDDCGDCVPDGTNPDDCLGVDTMPTEFNLAQNYPNPFNPVTTISFDVVANGSHIEIKVYDILGNYVNTLTSKYYVAGEHDVQWNGTNNSNVDVPSGVYIYQLTHNVGTITKKMILLR